MPAGHVAVEYDDTVAVLRMQRPPVNAIDLAFTEELEAALGEVIDGGRAGALVVTGTGTCFCAGLDLKRVPFYGPQEQRTMITTVNRTVTRLYGCPLPVVGAVNGHAIAGGLVLAIACDYRVGARTACQLGLTEARAGIPFPAATMEVLRAELPPHVVRVLTLRARNVGPEAALACGVLDELQPADAVLPTALAAARDLAGIPRDAYVRIKRQVRAAALRAMEALVAHGSDPMLESWVSPQAGTASAELLRGREG